MKKSMLLFAATLNLFATDAWIGTWEKVSSTLRLDPPAQQIITPRPNGLTLEHKAGINSFTWSADFDGRDYPVSGNPPQGTDGVLLRRVTDTCFEVTSKKAGKTIMVSTFRVSAGGKQMSSSNAYPGRLGTNDYFFERTGGSPDKNLFAGSWTMNYDKALALSQYSVTYEPDGKDGLRFSTSSSAAAWAGQFDGKEYPVTTKYRAWTSVTLRRIDERTFEVTGKRANTGPEIWHVSVSNDGRLLTLDGRGAWSSGASITLHEVLKRK